MTVPLTLWNEEDDIPAISDRFTDESQLILHVGDACQFLQTLPDNFAKLIVTSPPYNVGKEYEIRTGIHEYLRVQQQVIGEIVRLLDTTGSICWQVGNYVEDGEVFPLNIFYYNIFKEYGLKLRNRIIWRYSHGFHMSKDSSGRYETILWFTKSEDYTFNLDPGKSGPILSPIWDILP